MTYRTYQGDWDIEGESDGYYPQAPAYALKARSGYRIRTLISPDPKPKLEECFGYSVGIGGKLVIVGASYAPTGSSIPNKQSKGGQIKA